MSFSYLSWERRGTHKWRDQPRRAPLESSRRQQRARLLATGRKRTWEQQWFQQGSAAGNQVCGMGGGGGKDGAKGGVATKDNNKRARAKDDGAAKDTKRARAKDDGAPGGTAPAEAKFARGGGGNQ